MADDVVDPRETELHPRFRERVFGHDKAAQSFLDGLKNGRLHHAWMICGPEGVGKASLAYQLATKVLSVSSETAQVQRSIRARAHADFFVLERQMADRKPARIKSEISVDDARKFGEFFSHTASGTWRVGLIDAVDDLSSESGNAILKLVEEPPKNCLLLLVCHQPGRVLRTLRSRCQRLLLHPLQTQDMRNVFNNLPLSDDQLNKALSTMVAGTGSPGKALMLIGSQAAQVFQKLSGFSRVPAEQRLSLVQSFGPRGPSADEYNTFISLLLGLISQKKLTEAYREIAAEARIADGFNLDRRQALSLALQKYDEALKAA